MNNVEIEQILKCALREKLNKEFDLKKEELLKTLNLEIELKRNDIIGTLIDTLSIEASRNMGGIEPIINIRITTRPKIIFKED